MFHQRPPGRSLRSYPGPKWWRCRGTAPRVLIYPTKKGITSVVTLTVTARHVSRRYRRRRRKSRRSQEQDRCSRLARSTRFVLRGVLGRSEVNGGLVPLTVTLRRAARSIYICRLGRCLLIHVAKAPTTRLFFWNPISRIYFIPPMGDNHYRLTTPIYHKESRESIESDEMYIGGGGGRGRIPSPASGPHGGEIQRFNARESHRHRVS